jgi:predicted nucleotide-binding protein (sugar kinase/HSP70/actin superfamily)
VKYIAKRAAKNINSEESQTIVPTATRLGRLGFKAGVAMALIGEIIPEIDRNASFRP